MNAYEFVLVEVQDRIATLTLNRPDKLNAISGRMGQEVPEALMTLARDDAVRVIVVTGAGRAFCAGADIAYLSERLAADDWEAAEGLVEAGRAIAEAIHSAPKPVIASVNGPAAGAGANLALACDLRIASERASIGQSFNRIGLHPDWGGTYFLPRLVGRAKALELVFTGEMVDAPEALRLGLFNHVVPDEALPAETEALARALAAKPPIAMALAKKAIDASDRSSLEEMLALEEEHQLRCLRSADAREGVAAFLERRAPAFRGE